MVIWRGRREDDGPALVSAARQSHARLCHKVTREKGKKKKKKKPTLYMSFLKVQHVCSFK